MNQPPNLHADLQADLKVGLQVTNLQLENHPQRSSEWFRSRLGLLTGSRLPVALGYSPYQTPQQLQHTLECERKIEQLEWEIEPEAPSAAMKKGIDREPLILDEWVKLQNSDIEKHLHYPGFYRADIKLTNADESVTLVTGCSPDAVVELDNGLRTMIEVKWTGGSISKAKIKMWQAQCTFNAQLLGCSEAVVIYQRRDEAVQWLEAQNQLSSSDLVRLWNFAQAVTKQVTRAITRTVNGAG